MPTAKQPSIPSAPEGDDAEDLAKLTADLYERFRPADVSERFLVDTLVHNQWRLRRLRRMEDQYFEQLAEISLDPSKKLDPAFAAAFERLQRLVDGCERSFHRAIKELVAISQARRTGQAKNLARKRSKLEVPKPPDKKISDTFEAFDASFQSILKQ